MHTHHAIIELKVTHVCVYTTDVEIECKLDSKKCEKAKKKGRSMLINNQLRSISFIL